MSQIDMSVIADLVTDDLSVRLTFDGEYHTLWITNGEAWTMTFDFSDAQAKVVRDGLLNVTRELDRFIEGDAGGPTPETVRHALTPGDTE